jgi:hypothetical protein
VKRQFEERPESYGPIRALAIGRDHSFDRKLPILMKMSGRDNNDWYNIAAMLLSEPQKSSTVPAGPRGAYRALASICSNSSNSWAAAASLALGGPPLPPLTPPNALATAIASTPIYPTLVTPWSYVIRRFDQLIGAIGIFTEEITDGMKKAMRVVGSLNRAYYGHSSETDIGCSIGFLSRVAPCFCHSARSASETLALMS